MKDKNIIVATDFSQKSFNVIAKAYKFATTKGANLHIVHIVEESFFSKVENIDAITQTSLTMLQNKFSQLEKENFHCIVNEVAQGLQKCVEQLDASMVIIGASGEDGAIKKFFLGSSTKSIVRHVRVPCLVVKTEDTMQYKNIFVATDLSENSKKHILRLSEIFGDSYINLFYTYIVPFESRLGFYGMNQDEISEFQRDIASNARAEAYRFYEGLHVDQSRVKLNVKEGHLDTEFFLQEVDASKSDLIALHTTGHVSFFAFDLLGDAKNDVFIYKL
jgi:nucleotide-binding universal stress UspA family protein